MDNEILESVLREILEEQRAGIQETKQINTRIQELADKVETLSNQRSAVQASEIGLMKTLVKTGIHRMQEIVSEQPKPVVRQFRFLLFPEMYADSYYRIVFGRLLFWMMIFLLATYLFVLGKQGIDGWTIVKQKEVEGNQYKKAWNYLYRNEKKLRVKMDSAWVKSKLVMF